MDPALQIASQKIYEKLALTTFEALSEPSWASSGLAGVKSPRARHSKLPELWGEAGLRLVIVCHTASRSNASSKATDVRLGLFREIRSALFPLLTAFYISANLTVAVEQK